MEVVWSYSAKETLAAVLEYVEEAFNSEIAINVYHKINSHVDSLGFFPRIGVKDFRFSNSEIEVRYLVNTPNIIHYAIIQNTIVVVSVFDTRKSPEAIVAFLKEFLDRNKK